MAIATGTALAIAAVGTGLSAYGKFQEGKTAKKVSEFNAAEQRQEATRVEMESRREATRKQERNKRTLATIRARFAKSGLEFTGSPAEVLAEKSVLLNMELEDARRGEAAATTRLERKAGLTEVFGKKQYEAGIIGAGTDILGGVAQMGGAL
jgi:hypothetical protein